MALPALLAALVSQAPQPQIRIADIAATPEGRYFAVAAGASAILLYDVNSGAVVRTLRYPDGQARLTDIEISHESKYLLAGNAMEVGYCPLWNTETWEFLRRIAVWVGPRTPRSPGGVEIAGNGKYIYGRMMPGQATVCWDAATGRILRKVSNKPTWSYATMPGTSILVMRQEGVDEPVWWAPENEPDLVKWKAVQFGLRERLFLFSKKGDVLLSMESGRRRAVLHFRTFANGKPKDTRLEVEGFSVMDGEWTPDDRSVYLTARGGQFAVFDARSGKKTRQWSAHDGQDIPAIAVSLDGKTVVSGAGDTMCVWQAATGKLLRTIKLTKASFAPARA